MNRTLLFSRIGLPVVLCCLHQTINLIMKLRILGLLFLGLILSSFYLLDGVRGKESPEEVMEAFYKALSNRDFEEAKRYATPKAQVFLSTMQRLVEQSPEEQTSEMPKLERVECESLYKRVEKCKPCCDENGNPAEEAAYLVKIKGDWKVHMTKETSQSDMQIEDYDAFIESAKEIPELPSVELGKVANTPEAVALAFKMCVSAGAFLQAKEFATARSSESLTTLSSIVLILPEEERANNFLGPEGLTKAECTAEEDGTFRCTVCCSESDLVDEEILLVQEDEQWKVQFYKEGEASSTEEAAPATAPPSIDDEKE